MLVDDEVIDCSQQQNMYQDLHNRIDPDFVENGSVSSLHKCASEEAKKLCIYDLPKKLRQGGEYDIGGTYTGLESDLWFYYSTSTCPGYNYLLNLFVCHRKVGTFSVGVSNSNKLIHYDRSGQDISGFSVFPHTLKLYTFKSTQPNESFHIKTYCLTKNCLEALEKNTLFIPLSVTMNSSQTINSEVIKSLKLQQDLTGLLTKKEKTDFILVSGSGRKFPVHKIILLAHSAILRNLVKDTEHEAFIDIEDGDMELLLQFLYTGTIRDICKQDCTNLLNIADKLCLQNLFLLVQYALGEQIHVENAVEIALVSHKYQLDKLLQTVIKFIKNNPKVLQTTSWRQLNDVDLMKQLVEQIYTV